MGFSPHCEATIVGKGAFFDGRKHTFRQYMFKKKADVELASVLGSFLSPDDFAVVTTPKRRHKERNFATLIAMRIAEQLGLPFFEDCAFAPSKHRVGTVFTANNIPPQRNIIVFDDFVTTGQTLVSMQNLLVSLGKNCTFFAGINNKL